MSIKSPDSILCFKDLYFLATQHAGAQVGKPRKGKNGGRRRIVLTVHSLGKQQQQISNSAAAAAAVLQWHHCCFGLLTLGHAGDYTCLECPAVHSAQCSEQCTMHNAVNSAVNNAVHNAQCREEDRTDRARGSRGSFRLSNLVQARMEQHSTSSVVPSNVRGASSVCS